MHRAPKVRVHHQEVLKQDPGQDRASDADADAQRQAQASRKDGIAAVGERISPGDVYVNKQSPGNTRDPLPNPQAMPDSFYRPTAQSYKGPQGESCVVDKVMLTTSDEGQFNVKCLVRHTRRPEVGDKFSSRHGQKGVCGTIVEQSDLPFSERGYART